MPINPYQRQRKLTPTKSFEFEEINRAAMKTNWDEMRVRPMHWPYFGLLLRVKRLIKGLQAVYFVDNVSPNCCLTEGT